MTKAIKWLSAELPFVVYQNPDDSMLQGVFQADASLKTTDDLKTPGFVFAPFAGDGDKILLTGKYQKEVTPPIEIQKPEKEIIFSDEGKSSHIRLVRNAIKEIEGGNLKKVVVSRCFEVATRQPPSRIFTALLTKYPMAFRYWWYHPKVGMWFGATPERLLQYHDGMLSTTSLAGTLPVLNDEKPLWTPKEREEQQMVTDYIVQNLKGRLTNMNITGPDTIKAGKLWHLKSIVAGNLNALNDLGTTVKSLHPTPAVCGLPRKDSLAYILQHEGYHRQYYTGYLGPVHLDKKEHISLYVNLRCFKYSSGKAQVFVGGGITADSDPEQEWLETHYKSGTILEVL